MSLNNFIPTGLENSVEISKNTIIIPACPDNTLAYRFYTTVGKRRHTILKAGNIIELSESNLLVVLENGKIKDIIEGKGKYIYNSDDDNIRMVNDGRLTRYLKDENNDNSVIHQFYEMIKDIKFKDKDFRLYVVNTKIFNDIHFNINEPLAYSDARYGILFARMYGKLSVKILNPLIVVAKMILNKNCDEWTINNEIINYIDKFNSSIASTISELSYEKNLQFNELDSVSVQVTDKMKKKIGKKMMDNSGIELIGVYFSSILPTAESREYMLENDG